MSRLLVHLEHFLYKAKPAPVKESRHTCLEWMSHVTFMNESCHAYEWVTYEWVMSHFCPMNASCHADEWVMSHVSMRHVSLIHESWYSHECVTSHVSLGHITQTNESCHTYFGHFELFVLQTTPRTSRWVMSHMPRMNESRHANLRHLEHLFYEEKPTHVNASRQPCLVWLSHVTLPRAPSLFRRERLLFYAEKLAYVNESCRSWLEADRLITITRQGGRK